MEKKFDDLIADYVKTIPGSNKNRKTLRKLMYMARTFDDYQKLFLATTPKTPQEIIYIIENKLTRLSVTKNREQAKRIKEFYDYKRKHRKNNGKVHILMEGMRK